MAVQLFSQAGQPFPQIPLRFGECARIHALLGLLSAELTENPVGILRRLLDALQRFLFLRVEHPALAAFVRCEGFAYLFQ